MLKAWCVRDLKWLLLAPGKNTVLVSVTTHLAHFCPRILQAIVHRHKYKVPWLIHYVKSLSYNHLHGHMVKAEVENIKWRLPLKSCFYSFVHMPYDSFYHTTFFLQVLPTPASTKARQSSLNGCFQHFPFILISGMVKCIIWHTFESQHWIQNYWFLHRLFHRAILLQHLSALRALTDVLTGEAGEAVTSTLQPLK